MTTTLKRVAIVLAAAGVPLVFLTGCGGGDDEAGGEAENSSFDVAGQVLAPIDVADQLDTGMKLGEDEDFVHGETPCIADRSTAGEVVEGAEVVVKDASGKSVGLGHLDAGVMGGSDDLAPIDSPCAFGFTVSDVPAGSEIYTVEVGGAEKTFKEADLSGSEVSIDLTQ